ncbi:Toxin RelK [termite gut metagenome]|uniref:Toxin RelK n=1 Tax=termite gut metagenome TaxID=433724 RepID=A0A5J4SN60_9ZZZZ
MCNPHNRGNRKASWAMNYKLSFSEKAEKELEEYERAGSKKKSIKIRNLFKELKEHPTTGTGKPELLKYNYSGYLVSPD